MELPNPSINPPKLQSSSARWSLHHPRSPSRSPVRLQHFDPLLRDLSPTSTLRAFSAAPDENQSHPLANSVRDTTHAQRALGVKAAQTCLNVRSWARELELWHWPGTFETPEMAMSSEVSFANEVEDNEYWGSLPAVTIREYERKIHEIRDNLDEVDVEELKDFVLSAHSQASDAPADIDDSIGAIGAATDLKRLDDFTSLITATILQTLPYLSRLNLLLANWSLRASILKAAPAYSEDLARTRQELNQNWALLRNSTSSTDKLAMSNFSKESMQSTKTVISGQLHDLGQRLDSFLDQLEGRSETVPESWIDDFEQLEAQYGEWVVQAERRALELEWQAIADESDRSDIVTKASEPDVSGVADSGYLPDLSPDKIHSSIAELEDSPINPNRGSHSATATNQGSHQPPIGSLAAIATQPVAMIEDPSRFVSRHQSNASRTSSQSSIPPMRHIPITIDYKQDATAGSNDSFMDLESTDGSASLASDSGKPPASSGVKVRAAFFNREFEKRGTLNKSKSPPVVRPFEHASNAFTRLFKKTASPENRKRGSSISSKRKVPPQGTKENNQVASPFHGERLQTSETRPSSSRRDPTSENESFESHGIPIAYSPEPYTAQSANVVAFEAQVPPPRLQESQAQSHWTVDTTTTPSKSNGPATYIPTGMLSSPFHSPTRTEWTPAEVNNVSSELEEGSDQDTSQHPPDWPLSSGVLPVVVGEAASGATRRSAEDNSYAVLHQQQLTSDSSSPASIIHRSEMEDSESLTPRPTDLTPQVTRLHSGRDIRVIPRPISTVEEEGATAADDQATDFLPAAAVATEVASNLPTKHLKGRSRSASIINMTYAEIHPRDTYSDPERTGKHDVFYRRASSTSIDRFARSELKAIDVRPSPSRRHSASSALFRECLSPQLPNDKSLPSSPGTLPFPTFDHGASPLDFNGQIFPTPPARKSSLPTRPDSLTNSPISSRPRAATEALANDNSPLDSLVIKRREKAGIRRLSQESSIPVPSSPSSSTKQSGGDNFDRHVSAVLDRVHAPIRFRTRPGAETPLGNRPNEAKSYNSLAAKTGRPFAKGGSNITLAPAEPSPKKFRPGVEDVKVYHLQTGKDEPIKLFVRLVGEEERVMVRVGGGWADLADYLRQYADHHGSRAVSEGGFEVQAAALANNTTTVNSNKINSTEAGTGERRTFSMPVDSSRLKSAAPRTPVNRSLPKERLWLQDNEYEMANQPKVTSTFGYSRSPSYGSPSTQFPQRTVTQTTPTTTTTTWTPSATTNTTTTTTVVRGTPRSAASSTTNSRPSTADGPRPANTLGDVATTVTTSTSAASSSIGLGRPSSGKKADLPEQKARWVEDMLGRAKASAEKRKGEDENEKYFGELGRVGGTRRIVFRQHSGTGSKGSGP